MLEVHPPHEKIHGFRDFLLHLLTITIGLLIALGLEAIVEQVHHNNQRAEVNEILRHELAHNRLDVESIRKSVQKERENLTAVLNYFQIRALNQKYAGNNLNIDMRLTTLQDASWRTASATGVLSYMDYEQVQRYAGAYEVQGEFQNVERQALANILTLQSYFVGLSDADKLPTADADAAKPEVRLALAHLAAIDEIGAALTKAYDEALK